MPAASEGPVLGGDRPDFARSTAPGGGDGPGQESGRPDEKGGRAGPDAAVDWGRRQRQPPKASVSVLAERIAAALVHHEPGWRLPRHTALARRYNVSTAEIDAAVTELAARNLVRRLTDGQLYRASPAEYLIPIEGVPGLASRADPMGGELICQSWQAAWRRVPEDIGWALGIPSEDPVGVVRTRWTADGKHAAFSTTYLVKEIAAPFIGAPGAGQSPGPTLPPITAPPTRPDPKRGDLVPVGEPRAVQVEMQPPPPSVARSLRLPAGVPAAIVTVRFDDPGDGRPVALTFAVFRPEMFRIAVDAGESLPGHSEDSSFSGAWAHATEDWEP